MVGTNMVGMMSMVGSMKVVEMTSTVGMMKVGGTDWHGGDG